MYVVGTAWLWSFWYHQNSPGLSLWTCRNNPELPASSARSVGHNVTHPGPGECRPPRVMEVKGGTLQGGGIGGMGERH